MTWRISTLFRVIREVACCCCCCSAALDRGLVAVKALFRMMESILPELGVRMASC